MARTFDGANSKIAATITDIGTPPLTFLAWVRANSAGESSAGRIIRSEISGGTGSELQLAAGPVLRWNTNYNTINAEANASTALTVGQPWCVAGVLGADHIPHLYQGSLTTPMAEVAYASQVTGVGGAATGINRLVVGNTTAQVLTFDGIIAYPTVYQRVLRRDEMEMYRKATMPSLAAFYWPLTQYDVTQSYEYIKGSNGVDTSTTYADDPLPMRFNRPLFRDPRARPHPFRPGRPTTRIRANGGGLQR